MSSRALGRRSKAFLRAALFAILTPVSPLARLAQGHRPIVLAYHDPDPATFEAHLAALSRRHAIVPLATILSALAAGDLGMLPRRPLALTIDDGRRGNRAIAETCRRHEVRPTIFTCTGVSGRYWWSGLDPLEQRRLKSLPDVDRRDFLKGRAAHDGAVREALDPDDIRTLSTTFDFAPHTRTHPVLPHCDDATAADEIVGSKADLEGILGRRCEVFAYPNGDFGDRDVELVRGAGFRWAFGTRPGLAVPSSDPLRLPRIVVRDDAPAREALVRASGLPGRLQALIPPRMWSALQVR